jgi:hypothetical protein
VDWDVAEQERVSGLVLCEWWCTELGSRREDEREGEGARERDGDGGTPAGPRALLGCRGGCFAIDYNCISSWYFSCLNALSFFKSHNYVMNFLKQNPLQRVCVVETLSRAFCFGEEEEEEGVWRETSCD